jgi:hypothetical protein
MIYGEDGAPFHIIFHRRCYEIFITRRRAEGEGATKSSPEGRAPSVGVMESLSEARAPSVGGTKSSRKGRAPSVSAMKSLSEGRALSVGATKS